MGHGRWPVRQAMARNDGSTPILALRTATARPAATGPGCVETRWHCNAARDPEPRGAFDCALAPIAADEKLIPCDAFLTSLRASFQYLPSAHAPTSRIAFIVFLKPRILSTRVRL